MLGIRPQTREFLDAARAAGADQAVDERRRRLIDVYFSSRVSLADLGKGAGVSGGHVSRLLRSGLVTIWEHLPPDLQEAHPAEQVIFLRDNSGRGQKRRPMTTEHRARMSQAKKGRKHTEESREKMRRAQKKAWKKRKQGQERPAEE